MITRNYDQKRGCVNGVEVVLASMRSHSITVRMPGGELVVLPRINSIISTEDSGLPFVMHRRQFPIIPAFALTVHRVQGQSLKFLGLYFTGDVFCHGMLYTALSRVRSWEDVCVFCSNLNLLNPACVLANMVRRHIIAKIWQ
jgi:ATP-dependent DNA helicase PIF1